VLVPLGAARLILGELRGVGVGIEELIGQGDERGHLALGRVGGKLG
jgi:hypothetical protein